MSSKPGIVCTLQKGKLIDSQTGFVDTFNWIASWISNFKFDSKTGLKLDLTKSDRPTVKPEKEKKDDVVKVVTSIAYDEVTHKLTYVTQEVTSFELLENSSETHTVFTATPLSNA